VIPFPPFPLRLAFQCGDCGRPCSCTNGTFLFIMFDAANTSTAIVINRFRWSYSARKMSTSPLRIIAFRYSDRRQWEAVIAAEDWSAFWNQYKWSSIQSLTCAAESTQMRTTGSLRPHDQFWIVIWGTLRRNARVRRVARKLVFSLLNWTWDDQDSGIHRVPPQRVHPWGSLQLF